MNFLAIYLEFSITHRVGTERNGTIIFISPFLIYFQPTLAWNEFIMVFFNFFVIFLEFSFMPQVRMEQKDNFYFFSFAAFSYQFSLEMKPQWYFLAICLEFSITHWVGTERNGTKIFIFYLSQPLPTYFGLKWGRNGIFLIFWIFWRCFFGIFYYTSGRNGTIIFMFSLSWPFQSYFGLKWSHNDIF